MPDTIPNLWSPDINVNTLTPSAVLRAQAGMLGKMTKGILTAQVTALERDNDRIEHTLDLRAPALENYRYRVLTAYHRKNLVYPVTVSAECFEQGGSKEYYDHNEGWVSPEASGETEFIELVGSVLRSPEVVSVIHSLIARSNEQPESENPPTQPQVEYEEE
jgi:hypothetical protein